MLKIFRRHARTCPHRKEGRKHGKCKCPIWAQGTLAGVAVRKSLGSRNWQKAERDVSKWNYEDRWEPKADAAIDAGPVSLEDACLQFENDAEARKLCDSTVYKYKAVFGQLKNFAAGRGIRFVSELNVEVMTAFRGTWKDGARSSAKKLERLRTFFRFCERRKWTDSNPAADLKAPRVSVKPTLPFTGDEMLKILGDGLGKYADKMGGRGRLNARRLRALVLLMRYSGLRISDAVRLSADKLKDNRLFLYTAKTGTPVYTVLPGFVVKELEATPRMTERFFFWSGTSKPESAVKVWETRLHEMFTLAKMPKAHAHQFRDTFAVELLLSGVPIERVSVLLGHTSVRITEKHYSPWTQSRQAQIEADLERAWAHDPVILAQDAGTKLGHGSRRLQ